MKAKWVKAAGLLVAGSLVFSAAYIDGKPGVKDTQEVMAESTDSQIHEVSAGGVFHIGRTDGKLYKTGYGSCIRCY